MAFRNQIDDLALCTTFWVLLAAAGIYIGITDGHFPWYFGLGVFTGVAALGIWFQIRSAGYIFATINAVLALFGLVGMMINGFSLKPGIRLVGTFYAAYIAFEWATSRRK